MTPLQILIVQTLIPVQEFVSITAIVRKGNFAKNISFREVSEACEELVKTSVLEKTRSVPGKAKRMHGYRLSGHMVAALTKRGVYDAS